MLGKPIAVTKWKNLTGRILICDRIGQNFHRVWVQLRFEF